MVPSLVYDSYVYGTMDNVSLPRAFLLIFYFGLYNNYAVCIRCIAILLNFHEILTLPYWFGLYLIFEQKSILSRCADLNRGPTPYHGVALPTELHRHLYLIDVLHIKRKCIGIQLYILFEPPRGLEPRTFALQKRCSTN